MSHLWCLLALASVVVGVPNAVSVVSKLSGQYRLADLRRTYVGNHDPHPHFSPAVDIVDHQRLFPHYCS